MQAQLAIIIDRCENPSIRRVQKLAKAVYGLDIERGKIELPLNNQVKRVGLKAEYPDCWSIFLIAKTQYQKLRKIWGDDIADRWAHQLTNDDNFWYWWQELLDSTTAFGDRRSIDWRTKYAELTLVPEIATLYDATIAREMMLMAIERVKVEHPEPEVGVKYPIDSPEWRKFKREQYERECVERAYTEQELLEYFTNFWVAVAKRGEDYLANLRRAVNGSPDAPLSQKPFYTSCENNFRHFLHNLEGFKHKAPYRIVVTSPPQLPLRSMELEGALIKYGHSRVKIAVTCGLLNSYAQK